MSSHTPTVFVHSGKSWFLPYALYQARHSDPGSKVFLIGDQSPMGGVELRSAAGLENDASRRFREVFQPMSPNPPQFELMCYLRWFYLSEFLKREGFADVFYFDSDVLSYSSGEELKSSMLDGGQECGLSIVAQPTDSCDWTACGHASYWQAGILSEFCDFCIRTYTEGKYLGRYEEKLAWHDRRGIRGGINDMTTLYLFWEENRDRIANLAIRRNEAVVDHNVRFSANYQEGEYQLENGLKKLRQLRGKSFIFDAASGDPVRVHSVHFQGAGKPFMPFHYTGPSFPGKSWSEFRRAVNTAPKRFRRWFRGK